MKRVWVMVLLLAVGCSEEHVISRRELLATKLQSAMGQTKAQALEFLGSPKAVQNIAGVEVWKFENDGPAYTAGGTVGSAGPWPYELSTSSRSVSRLARETYSVYFKNGRAYNRDASVTESKGTVVFDQQNPDGQRTW